ncbi:unnamed protein product [Amoebophrya sp. A25]|nr:unnamed protein product [Amoebophrya sp. A25]|eukprot:GSA25T00027027001.1
MGLTNGKNVKTNTGVQEVHAPNEAKTGMGKKKAANEEDTAASHLGTKGAVDYLLGESVLLGKYDYGLSRFLTDAQVWGFSLLTANEKKDVERARRKLDAVCKGGRQKSMTIDGQRLEATSECRIGKADDPDQDFQVITYLSRLDYVADEWVTLECIHVFLRKGDSLQFMAWATVRPELTNEPEPRIVADFSRLVASGRLEESHNIWHKATEGQPHWVQFHKKLVPEMFSPPMAFLEVQSPALRVAGAFVPLRGPSFALLSGFVLLLVCLLFSRRFRRSVTRFFRNYASAQPTKGEPAHQNMIVDAINPEGYGATGSMKPVEANAEDSLATTSLDAGALMPDEEATWEIQEV